MTKQTNKETTKQTNKNPTSQALFIVQNALVINAEAGNLSETESADENSSWL